MHTNAHYVHWVHYSITYNGPFLFHTYLKVITLFQSTSQLWSKTPAFPKFFRLTAGLCGSNHSIKLRQLTVHIHSLSKIAISSTISFSPSIITKHLVPTEFFSCSHAQLCTVLYFHFLQLGFLLSWSQWNQYYKVKILHLKSISSPFYICKFY